MGKTRRCTGCKTPLSDHTFGKPGKGCSGPKHFPDVSFVEEDNAHPSQSVPVETEPRESPLFARGGKISYHRLEGSPG